MVANVVVATAADVDGVVFHVVVVLLVCLRNYSELIVLIILAQVSFRSHLSVI